MWDLRVSLRWLSTLRKPMWTEVLMNWKLTKNTSENVRKMQVNLKKSSRRSFALSSVSDVRKTCQNLSYLDRAYWRAGPTPLYWRLGNALAFPPSWSRWRLWRSLRIADTWRISTVTRLRGAARHGGSTAGRGREFERRHSRRESYAGRLGGLLPSSRHPHIAPSQDPPQDCQELGFDASPRNREERKRHQWQLLWCSEQALLNILERAQDKSTRMSAEKQFLKNLYI